jgi:hypothetical protein
MHSKATLSVETYTSTAVLFLTPFMIRTQRDVQKLRISSISWEPTFFKRLLKLILLAVKSSYWK